MADLPALPLGEPDRRERETGQAGRGRLDGPGAGRQAERLGPSFERLSNAFEQARVGVADDPGAHDPELVLVLEVAGEIDKFAAAVQRVPGLEFLAEEVLEKIDPDEFSVVDSRGRAKPYGRQLLLVMSDQTAWNELLSLWERYKRGEDPERGFAKFRDLFKQLKELRAWNDGDRLERTGAAQVWAEEFADLGDQLVDFEIELWRRAGEDDRDRAEANLRAELENAGGGLMSTFHLAEIDYHGVLGRVPASRLMDAVEHREVRWMSSHGVRFFRAVGQIANSDLLEPDQLSSVEDREEINADQLPRVGVLDGVPLAGHIALRGRLLIDDPEGLEETTPAERRNHGTGIASVVLHGDLGDDSPSLEGPIYLRPVLTSEAPDWIPDAREELPRDRLAVDLIHSAVARLFIDSDVPAAAPTVRVIVLALGDTAVQFDRSISPLARLLDWLSTRFEVLFLVPAGNHLASLEIPADTGMEDPQEIQHEVLRAIRQSAAYRRLLSPAEAINALTIGAAHADAASHRVEDDRVEPIATPDLPNVSTAVGGGLRRSVKPDLLLPGGRQFVRLEPPNEDTGTRLVTIPATRRAPGVLMAAPSPIEGTLDAALHAVGTSVATGMAGHAAGRVLARLERLRDLYGPDRFPGAEFDAVLLKAAMIHGARWGTAGPFIDAVLEDLDAPRTRESIARQLGYGAARPEEAIECDSHIVTALAAGRLGKDQAHAYRFPLPPSLASRTEHRRVTLSLAWVSPINPRHRNYRRAHLKLEPNAPGEFMGARSDADQHQARRGTSQHDVLEGDRAVPFAAGSAIELLVSCRADAGALDTTVPYAILVTIEVPQQLDLRIYEEVREALRVAVGVRAARG